MKTRTGEYFVVGACGYGQGTNRWLRTIENLGPDAMPMLLMYEPHFDVPDGFHVVRKNMKYPGNNKRYEPLIDILPEYPDTWFLVTDVWDVAFQAPVAIPSDDLDIVVSSENIKYKDAEWWIVQECFKGEYEKLLDDDVYNGGLFMMRGRALELYLKEVAALSDTQPFYTDQLLLSLFARSRAHCVEPSFLNLYNNTSNYTIKKNRFYSKNTGGLYSVVHGNGSYLNILDVAVPR